MAIPEDLCDWGNWRHDRSDTKIGDITRKVTIGSLLWAVTRDVAGLTALVAGLTSSVQRTAIGSSTIAYEEVSTFVSRK